jgi:hypothetical protein
MAQLEQIDQTLPPDVQKVYFQNGLIIKTEEDVEWYDWNIDGPVRKKIAKELWELNQ